MIPHSGLPEAGWDIVVFDDPDHSAFVLPGGRVFISTGLINFCKSDDEVASLFGHEMAHNVSHHSAESVSRYLVWIPAVLISWLATGMDPDLLGTALQVAYILPGSRAQEREADYLGLLIMAESGYDASASLDLWSRWEEFEPDNSPSYLSTHPSHHDRTRSVYSWLKTARQERLSRQSLGRPRAHLLYCYEVANESSDDDFHRSYFLQRSFCGLNRTPMKGDTQRPPLPDSDADLAGSEVDSKPTKPIWDLITGRYALWQHIHPDGHLGAEEQNTSNLAIM